MTIESVAIDSLSADPANPRKHGQRNLDAIAASLRRFGQQKPIVVDSHGVVRAGNGQLAAAKMLGWTEIRVVRSDLPPAELTAFAVADNRTAELAEWDTEVLAGLLSDADLGDVGFTDEELKQFAGKTAAGEGSLAETEIHESFEVVAECRDEEQQKQLYERLRSEGFSCRLFTL
ncbi:MAG: ParB/Srx family N-terminal domain-containing protein [Tepidisphaeraceae bacterium]|jgi:site-specific DNA-methyltransferase (adenine-specific)